MNFLKNLFTSKKEKSEKKKTLTLSMPLFKGKQAYSLDQVVQELKAHWGLEISEVSGDDSFCQSLIFFRGIFIVHSHNKPLNHPGLIALLLCLKVVHPCRVS